MSIFYLAVAVVFLFTKYFPSVSGSIRITLGVVFALYGCYRVWRAVKKISQK
jgi:hypothetical protein